jgi:hypothetical protein
MFYALWIRALNNSFLKRVIRKTSKILTGKDITSDVFDNGALVKKYSVGKSFADIGALWGVDGLNTFIAEEAGATRSVAVDVYQETDAFIAEKARRKSKVEFVRGDINSQETIQKIGVCDVVLCSGVLYHTPDPIHMLMRLRAITGETLILNTASIPEMPWMRNVTVFYPFLNESQRKMWKRGIGMQKSITGPYEPKEGYANWFWGMTPSVLESILACSGFQVIEKHIFNFRAVFVCKTAPIQFVPESGEWTTPKDAESLKFR